MGEAAGEESLHSREATPGRRWLLFLAVVGVSFAVYAASPVSEEGGDTRWTVHTAVSVIETGDLNLDEYNAMISDERPPPILDNGHVYNLFPYGVSLLVVPVVAAVEWLVPGVSIAGYVSNRTLTGAIQRPLASLVTALAVGVMFLVALEVLGRRGLAVGVALAFAFGTSAWSLASRGLWMHGPSMLMLSLALLLAVLGRRDPRWINLMGLPVAYAYVVRPSNAVAVLLFSVFVLVGHRRQAPGYFAGAGLVAIAFFAVNRASFGAWFPIYFTDSPVGRNRDFLNALAVNLFSPARGLLVFSPFLALAAVGVWRKVRTRTFDALDRLALAVVVLHWVVISSFQFWWAGFAYGPRFFSDVIPFFVFLLLPAVASLARPDRLDWRTPRALVAPAVAALLLAFSVFVHFRGATQQSTVRWNAEPPPIKARVWDWSDPQFLH